MHPFLHLDPAHEPTHASAAGLLAQLAERALGLVSQGSGFDPDLFHKAY